MHHLRSFQLQHQQNVLHHPHDSLKEVYEIVPGECLSEKRLKFRWLFTRTDLEEHLILPMWTRVMCVFVVRGNFDGKFALSMAAIVCFARLCNCTLWPVVNASICPFSRSSWIRSVMLNGVLNDLFQRPFTACGRCRWSSILWLTCTYFYVRARVT